MSIPMGEVILAGWVSFGIIVRKVVEDGENRRLIVYIEVPETSEEYDANGVMMSGKHLARQAVKRTLEEMGLNVQVRVKVDKGVHWTKQMGKTAMNQALDQINPLRKYMK